MTKRSSELFEDWGTRFKNKLRTDPFFRARLKLMALFFVAGAFIFVIFGWTLGSISRSNFYPICRTEDGPPVEQAISVLERQLEYERLIMLFCFAIAAYVLTEIALRPIKKSSELQERFVAIVSHELRTPLTIMKNASEVALRNTDTLTLEKAIRVIRSDLEETNRLSDTVQFLLTFSTLKRWARPSDLQPTPLKAVADKVLPLMEKEAADRKITLSIDSDGPGIVRGNRIALEGMMINLIKNAIYHAPEGSTVTVSIKSNHKGVRLSVTDLGKGIAREDLPYIFEPFYRGIADDTESVTYKGVGLGLSIVKEIVTLHRASIAVSTREGKGTTFTILFPS